MKRVNDIRTAYLDFFKERGHVILPSASLVPANDPSTLFTGSGMQPLVPYLLGKDHPAGKRLANSQRCFRAMDIDEVGDNRHTTFFEMLGNWSLGDYFKKEQLPWFFEFLTEIVGLDPEDLYVTVFIGDEKNGIPRDTESATIWKELFAKKNIDAKDVVVGSEKDGYEKGMQGGRIFYYSADKNWWSRAGVPQNMPAGEPGGADSEVFFDFGTPHDGSFGPNCHPNCDCGRFLEIGNAVFMEYLKEGEGFKALPRRNVDFGAGLERIAAASLRIPDIFAVDVLADLVSYLEHYADGKPYSDPRYTKNYRIIADHMRAAVFMIADGVRPSNTERGYLLRRLLRRATSRAIALGAAQGQGENNELVRLATLVVENYRGPYPELSSEDMHQRLMNEIWSEEVQFARSQEQGLREFEKMTARATDVSGEDAFTLFTTYGFPLEETVELAKARGKTVDTETFNHLMKEHREVSRAGVTQKFRGGLADTSERTTRLHTAHHLLLASLQHVLGKEVKQRGSNITQERLRIDFSFGRKMTPEEIQKVEDLVNAKIQEALPVIRTVMPKVEAEKLGAQKEFGAKYADTVSVYSIGPKNATQDDPRFAEVFSIEFCGGPHVENTRELGGRFTIQKEEAVASGIRRIKAIVEAK